MIRHKLASLKKNQEGATVIEYCLLAAMVAVAAISGLTAFNQSFLGMSGTTADAVTEATSHVRE